MAPIQPTECDVVMKGGITSGVIYPRALAALGARYRLRGVGGASAGAIGAALGAAAEFARANADPGHELAGFDRLNLLPQDLGGGRLAALFQAQPKTKPLLRIVLTLAGTAKPGTPPEGLAKVSALVVALFAGFPVASVTSTIPGLVLAVCGVVFWGAAGILLLAASIPLIAVGWLTMMLLRLKRKLTVDVPANLFGICRGLGTQPDLPGFTEWLAKQIDDVAGLPAAQRPLRFGQLWTGTKSIGAPVSRSVDLRMISTCLSQGRPYELPLEAHNFFYEPQTWLTLFPAHVVQALDEAPPAVPPRAGDEEEWRWEEAQAAAHTPPLRRLPDPQYLPVVVATRLSLSYPLLISAVPLWTINHRSLQTQNAVGAFRAGTSGSSPEFAKLWFTDGGFCSNFPVHLFDAALPTRPTFAINLGPYSGEGEKIEYAKDNSSGLLPPYVPIPEKGLGAVMGFGSAAFNTARNWHDSSQLDAPGYRDRIVRVLQTKQEGGMNLYMESTTIEDLADRGGAAVTEIIQQFDEPRYPPKNPTATGWDNHRWVRYRALMSCLPDWLASYAAGGSLLGINPADPPSYDLTVRGQSLATQLGAALDNAAKIAASDRDAAGDLAAAPRPKGMIRRIPQI
ncbi:MAG TPA: hypothetical protein VGL05_15610 [Kribbella sp.]